jgi:hypothetical protein
MKTTDFGWGLSSVERLPDDHEVVTDYNVRMESYGNSLLFLTASDINHIKRGGVLVADVNGHEYHIIIAMERQP